MNVLFIMQSKVYSSQARDCILPGINKNLPFSLRKIPDLNPQNINTVTDKSEFRNVLHLFDCVHQ